MVDSHESGVRHLHVAFRCLTAASAGIGAPSPHAHTHGALTVKCDVAVSVATP